LRKGTGATHGTIRSLWREDIITRSRIIERRATSDQTATIRKRVRSFGNLDQRCEFKSARVGMTFDPRDLKSVVVPKVQRTMEWRSWKASGGWRTGWEPIDGTKVSANAEDGDVSLATSIAVVHNNVVGDGTFSVRIELREVRPYCQELALIAHVILLDQNVHVVHIEL